MDAEAIEEAGVAPLRPLTREGPTAGDRAALGIGARAAPREGIASLFGAYVSTDATDSGPATCEPVTVRARPA